MAGARGVTRSQSAELFSVCVSSPLVRFLPTYTLQIDVQVDNHHLLDHIEWDLRSGLTPEEFTHQLCLDLGLVGEAEPLIAHAIHEELMRHKKDAIEWGVIGGFPTEQAASTEDGAKDKSGLGLMKDKTGLGLGWGRTPKEGRGPRILRSVWRDWAEAEEFKTRWEMLSQEEVERREIERERASRCVRFFLRRCDALSKFLMSPIVDGCGERRRNSRVQPEQRGYDTSAFRLGFSYHIICLSFKITCCHPYNPTVCLFVPNSLSLCTKSRPRVVSTELTRIEHCT